MPQMPSVDLRCPDAAMPKQAKLATCYLLFEHET
jgi:hypothetical protein